MGNNFEEKNIGGNFESDVGHLIVGAATDLLSPDYETFFKQMPDLLRKGFHKAFLARLEQGLYGEKNDKDCQETTTADITPLASFDSHDLLRFYTDYLNRSFSFEDFLTILDKVKPINSSEQLLGLNKRTRNYHSLRSQGLENIVANMAIHRAALKTAGVSTDGWCSNNDILKTVKEKTTAELPVFLNNLYESLKDHPEVLIQAFKGLLKLPTLYSAVRRLSGKSRLPNIFGR